MFGDWNWQDHRTQAQQSRLNAWLADVSRPVVIELGAGTNIPTVRRFGEGLDVPLIRINTTEAAIVRRRDVSLSMGALEALHGIDAVLVGGWNVAPPSQATYSAEGQRCAACSTRRMVIVSPSARYTMM